MYINKQSIVQAQFNSNSIENLINVKITLKNIFYNSIQNITNLKICKTQPGGVFCLSSRDQLIIDIKYVNKQTNKIYINKQTNHIFINKTNNS